MGLSSTITSKSNDLTVLKLTSFWIFAEGGLGGAMHLLHIPLTGFLVGGFSVITNILIAYFSNYRRQFFKALTIVLVAKFLISPYAPVGAYVAVLFQGLLAFIIFPTLHLNKVSLFLYALLAMLESAVQKPLMAYIIFGSELAEGIQMVITDFFRNDLATGFILKALLIAYFSLYVLWSLLIGFWALRFIENYPQFNIKFGEAVRNIPSKIVEIAPANSSGKKLRWMLVVLFLIGISLVAVSAKEKSVGLYLFKTFGVLILFYGVLPKLLGFLQKSNTIKPHQLIYATQQMLPLMHDNARRANILSRHYKGLERIETFVHLVIWLNVFYDSDE